MLEKYSVKWMEKYNKEAEVIKRIIGPDIIDIQHIGSTAIPGLSAKPIIDIAVLVSSIKDFSHFVEPLKKIGYSYKQDMSSAERIFLRKGDPVEYHISIACPLHTYWERQILFRDYLKSHENFLKEYERLKIETINDIPKEELKDLSRSKIYSSKKGPFIEKVLKLARDSKKGLKC